MLMMETEKKNVKIKFVFHSLQPYPSSLIRSDRVFFPLMVAKLLARVYGHTTVDALREAVEQTRKNRER